jgi:hypothetical protein
MQAKKQNPQSQPSDEGTPETTTANATMHLCWCGCGSPVPAKSFYRPGHDSRHVGQVAREVADSDAFGSIVDHLPTRPLQLKAWNMAYKLHVDAARKQRKQKH